VMIANWKMLKKSMHQAKPSLQLWRKPVVAAPAVTEGLSP